MDKASIKARIKEIRQAISDLQAEECSLEILLEDSATSFKEKLEVWRDSSYKEHEDCIIDESEYPNLFKHFDGYFERHKTYDLVLWFRYDIEKILNDQEVKEDVLLCLKEAVEANLGSFTCDW